MESTTFQFPFTVKEAHLDLFGHVNNATYLSLLEEARWEIITASDFGIKRMLKEGIGPTILDINIKFHKELRLREQVVIQTQCIAYHGKIGKLEQKILRDNILCTHAILTIGLFDTRARKLIQATAEWLQAIGVSPSA